MTWSDFYLDLFCAGLHPESLLVVGSAHLHLPHHSLGHWRPCAWSSWNGRRGIGPGEFRHSDCFSRLVRRRRLFAHHAFSVVWFLLAFGIACLSGLLGAALVFFFLARVLVQKRRSTRSRRLRHDRGAGKVSSNIRASGTGEMIFSQGGARRAIPARSEERDRNHQRHRSRGNPLRPRNCVCPSMGRTDGISSRRLTEKELIMEKSIASIFLIAGFDGIGRDCF